MKNVMLFENWKDYEVIDPAPKNIERKQILNRRLKEINIKQEIQKEIDFLENIYNGNEDIWKEISRIIPQKSSFYNKIKTRIIELKNLLEDL